MDLTRAFWQIVLEPEQCMWAVFRLPDRMVLILNWVALITAAVSKWTTAWLSGKGRSSQLYISFIGNSHVYWISVAGAFLFLFIDWLCAVAYLNSEEFLSDGFMRWSFYESLLFVRLVERGESVGWLKVFFRKKNLKWGVVTGSPFQTNNLTDRRTLWLYNIWRLLVCNGNLLRARIKCFVFVRFVTWQSLLGLASWKVGSWQRDIACLAFQWGGRPSDTPGPGYNPNQRQFKVGDLYYYCLCVKLPRLVSRASLMKMGDSETEKRYVVYNLFRCR